MKNGLQIYIERNYAASDIRIWLTEESSEGTKMINVEDGEIISTFVKSNEAHPPTLKPFLQLPWRFAETFFQSVTDYQANNGKKTKNENYIEGGVECY